VDHVCSHRLGGQTQTEVGDQTMTVINKHEQFRVWMRKVDLRLLELTKGFCTSEDLPDRDWWTDFDSGLTPSSAVKRLVSEIKRGRW
jgi:hypothetical protein